MKHRTAEEILTVQEGFCSMEYVCLFLSDYTFSAPNGGPLNCTLQQNVAWCFFF